MHRTPTTTVLLVGVVLAFFALAPSASASKQAVDFFGGEGTLGGQFAAGGPAGVAVNDTGAGPADQGDAYVLDLGSHRIQRFGRDDNGTPANTADDTYFFISAWGADVDSTPSGGTDYEICTIAAECKAAVASGGNGTAAGNGALGDFGTATAGLALDQDTGDLYVADTGNHRVNVYDGAGAFLRSFGFDVVASGPGDAGTGYEVCVVAADLCKAGASGSGVGQIAETSGSQSQGIAVSAPDGNPATGTVFLADPGNLRINSYALDATSPSAVGPSSQFGATGPGELAVDSRGILYAAVHHTAAELDDPKIVRYDTVDTNGGGVGFLEPILSPADERQELHYNATAGQFRLTLGGFTTSDLPYNATDQQVRAALEALPSVGIGNLSSTSFFDSGGLAGVRLTFKGALAETDVAQLVVSNGTTPLTGTITVTTPRDGHPGPLPGQGGIGGLAVDPDSDGGGADTDVLFAARDSAHIAQIGPSNLPGLSAAPNAIDDTHGTNGIFTNTGALAAEPSTGRLYAAAPFGQASRGVYVLDESSPILPTATLDSIDNVTATSADLHATIDPNGPPATRYHFEYSLDGSSWVPLPEVVLGTQDDPQPVDEHLEPPPIGLQPNTEYHVRLLAGRKFAAPVISDVLTFTTDAVPPLVETAGAPVRTTTTAQFNGRVTPRNTATTYRFEYGTQGPCSANPCTATPDTPAGSDDLTKLVAAQVSGLTPDTTYHYRLLAENGVGAPVSGGDMTVRTRASDTLPGQSDAFPGPPGSDRAWEQVSIAESSGNPVAIGIPAYSFSDDGNRATYAIFGGTPISTAGSLRSNYFAERTPSGWQTSLITPARDQLVGNFWLGPWGPDDLSTMVALNKGSDSGQPEAAVWRLGPDADPTLLYERRSEFDFSTDALGISADGSLAIAFLNGGGHDPTYPSTVAANLYELDVAVARLVSLLPGEVVSPCGAYTPSPLQDVNWISEDGSRVYFQSRGLGSCETRPLQLYMRDLAAEQSTLISGPPISGPDCGGSLIRAIPGAAFFTTQSRLDDEDIEATACAGGNDVYRYDLGDASLDCLTCVTPGFSAGVQGDNAAEIAVAEDGSRLYFTSLKRLLPGAPPDGQQALYRLAVAGGELAFVAQVGGTVGTGGVQSELALDGEQLFFSSASAFVNPLGGTADNGGGRQYYRYDDSDRSLVCVSCPRDGSPPFGEVLAELHQTASTGANQRTLSADGETFAFTTPTPLIGADQNTPGPGQPPRAGDDVYEWRDGRLILITDGLTNWTIDPIVQASAAPIVLGTTPSGGDIFFTATAAYTPDAPDASMRLYTARIDGGIAFPQPPPPCPLEVCQGTPKGAPEEQPPGTSDFRGPGNPVEATPNRRRCPKGRRKVRRKGKVLCVKRRRAASSNRRTHR
jgi:hypothetical protein